MAAFLGLLASDDLATNENPESWRQGILLEFPNGMAPLTALTSLIRTEEVPNSTFHWWTESLAAQGGAVTSIYIDSGLDTEYVKATHQATYGIATGVVYAKCAEAVAAEFREGMVVLLRDASQWDVDLRGEVVDITKNGASSYVAVKLIEADDNSATTATYNLATVDYIWSIGSSSPQGGPIPDAITYPPTEYSNYTQIFWDTLEMTNTLMAESPDMRTGNVYQNKKRQVLQYHGIGIEKAGLFGYYYSRTGSNNKIQKFTRGMIPFITEYAPANTDDFATNTDVRFAGKTWLQAGKLWLDEMLELIFRYRGENQESPDKMAFCGSGAMLGLAQLAESLGTITLKTTEVLFGMKITEWQTPFGTVYLKTHPLLNDQDANRYSMILFNPENVRFRPLRGRDTTFVDDPNRLAPESGFFQVDGIKESWITEGGWEHHHPRTFGYLNGVGKDSAV